MNILYISPMTIDRGNMDGVAKKILAQCRAFESYSGVKNVYLASYFEDNKYLVVGKNYEEEIRYNKRSSRQLELFEIYPSMIEICKKLKITSIYFRIFSLSWVTDKLFKDLKKMNIKIAVEIPTYPFWKEKWIDVLHNIKSGKVSTGIKRTITNVVYFIYAQRLKRYIKTIVTFSDIKELWGIPVIGIANGYEFKDAKIEKTLKEKVKDLHLLMVASVRNNHGVDRVIKGLAEHEQDKNDRRVFFHIVGDGDAIPELKNLVRQLGNVSDYVIFHGFKSGKELEEIYELADIGISAIGFHRLGVRYASPLKSKEYFAKGMPVVGTSAEHDILKSSSNKFFLSIAEDDSNVNISEVCKFYDALKSEGCTNKKIIEAARLNFEWHNIMKPIYEQIK